MSDRTRIDRLVEDALACAAEERDAFLDAACDGDGPLRREVASLLAQAASAQSFLEAPAAAPSLIGWKLGPYRIDAPIGAGGMGEVYRARDTKLGRDVAIKILPAFMAQDPERLARLGREARTLAALNHPHIGSIYGLEEADGVRGLVLELVDGETLADRIAKGPMAIGEAVRIAGQIAQALAAAHARSIVHRDLKPANIKITTAGIVKVLDFGLAKAGAHETEATTLATREGTVMGTPAYMSPEQARGEAVDQQTDIWAFGCVLYEMLTASRAFGGRTASDAIAAVLKAEPDWPALPASTPVAIRTLLGRCLAKERARRLYSIADAQFDLVETPGSASPVPRAASRPAWQMWSLAAALALAVGVAGYLYGRAGDAAPALATYGVDLDLPDGTKPWAGLAISPDGKAIAASVGQNVRGDAKHLIVRYFDQLNGWQPVNGGTGGEYPFWSPNGKHLAFFVEGKLLRVDLPNGAPVVVCDVVDAKGVAQFGRGGVWLEDETIVFAGMEGPLMRVDAQGGSAPAVFVPLEEGQVSLRYPIAAGPRTLLYLAAYADATRSSLRAVNLDAPLRSTTVMKTSKSGIYERGHLFYDRDGAILRQRFDLATNQPQGEPVRVTSDTPQSSGHIGYLPLAAAGGHLAVAPIPPQLRQLVWMTREGRAVSELGDPMDQQTPDLSPDGKRLAVARRLAGESAQNIWIVDTQSSVSRRLTTGANDYRPIWADDQRLTFSSTRGLANNLYAVNVEGSPMLTALVEQDSNVQAVGWTPDGRLVWSALSSSDKDPSKVGIFVSAGSAGRREPAVPFRVGAAASNGRLSPDGRHIAYVSAKSGQLEVYVDAFPAPAARPEPVSRGPGRFPRWRADSRELYFLAEDELMAVTVSPGSTQSFGMPTKLFKVPPDQFAVSADGSKFLVLVPRSSPTSSLRLTLNWFSSLADTKDSPR